MDIAVEPLKEDSFPLPEKMQAEIAFLQESVPTDELAVSVSFTLKADTLWAKAGHELAFGQTVLPVEKAETVCDKALTVTRGTFNLGIRGEGFSVLFNGIRPGLCSYVYGGRELMKQMPVPNFWRAPTDNDRGNQMPSVMPSGRLQASMPLRRTGRAMTSIRSWSRGRTAPSSATATICRQSRLRAAW